MTNEKAIQILSAYIAFNGFVLYPDETFYEALECAVSALDTAKCIQIEVTEHHTFAKPDDVEDIKFGDE